MGSIMRGVMGDTAAPGPTIPVGWHNLKASNTVNARAKLNALLAGTSDMDIFAFGDSLTAGQGSDGVTNIGLRTLSYPNRQAALMGAALGVTPNTDNTFGSTEATSTTYPQYDTKMVMNGAAFSSTLVSAGGHVMTVLNNTIAPAYTPEKQFDLIDYYFINRVSAIDLVADATDTQTVASAASGALSSGTLTYGGLRSAFTVKAQLAAGFSWVGHACKRSDLKQLRVFNAGMRGSQIGTWTPNPSSNAYDPYRIVVAAAPAVAQMNLGTNDYVPQTLSNYQIQIARIIGQIKSASTDMIVIIPNYYAASDIDGSDGTGHATLAVINSFMQAMIDACVTADIPYFDTRELPGFSSYAAAKAALKMYDVTHPNGTGYNDQAVALTAGYVYMHQQFG